MTMGELRAVVQKLPFEPFLIHLADGRAIPVHHPDFVSAEQDGRIVRVTQSDETRYSIDLYMVTDLEILPPKKPGHETNGATVSPGN